MKDKADKQVRLLKLSNIAALRRTRRITQLEVAKRMGVSQSVVSRLERKGNLEAPTLERYIEALGGMLELVCFDSEGKASYLERTLAYRLLYVRLAHKKSIEEVATVMRRRTRVVVGIENQTACRLLTVKQYVEALSCRLVIRVVFSPEEIITLYLKNRQECSF